MGEDTELFQHDEYLKVKFTLDRLWGPQGEQRYSSTFFNHGARWGWVVNATPWPIYPLERDLVPIVSEAGWAPGLVWTGIENLASTGIQSPDHLTCSELLHHLHYPAHMKNI